MSAGTVGVLPFPNPGRTRLRIQGAQPVAPFENSQLLWAGRWAQVRIAIGGFQHETNTFAPSKATYSRFEKGEGWPPLMRGADLFDAVKGANIPIAGFIEGFRESRHTLVPTAWAAASPSAHVTEDAFERISSYVQRLFIPVSPSLANTCNMTEPFRYF